MCPMTRRVPRPTAAVIVVPICPRAGSWSPRADGFLDALPALRPALHPVLCVFRTDAENPVGLVESEVDQRADGLLTGHHSPRRTTPAIRHDETVTDLLGLGRHLVRQQVGQQSLH